MTGRNITILDGGMGKHLLRIGAPFRQPEWSALPLLEDPSFVLQAHRNFIAAGARLIITNAYSVVPFHLGEDRFAEQGAHLAALASTLARQAADEAGVAVQVAGSLPPLFGSYEPSLYRPVEGVAGWAKLIDAQAPHVDFWLGETVSSIAEANGILDAVEAHGGRVGPTDVWMSFCLNNHPPAEGATLVSNEPVAQAVAAVMERGVKGIMFNCCSPEVIAPALRELHTLLGENKGGVVTGAYANSFMPEEEGYAANEVILDHRVDLDPQGYDFCVQWADAGASVIGGCCGIHPEHIELLTARLA